LKNWTLDVEQNKVAQNELIDFRIMKAVDQDNLIMNEHFSKTMQKTFLNGFFYFFSIYLSKFHRYQSNFMESFVIQAQDMTVFNEEMKDFSRRNWRKVRNK